MLIKLGFIPKEALDAPVPVHEYGHQEDKGEHTHAGADESDQTVTIFTMDAKGEIFTESAQYDSTGTDTDTEKCRA